MVTSEKVTRIAKLIGRKIRVPSEDGIILTKTD